MLSASSDLEVASQPKEQQEGDERSDQDIGDDFDFEVLAGDNESGCNVALRRPERDCLHRFC